MQLFLAAPEAAGRHALTDAIASASGKAREPLSQMDRLWRETPDVYRLVTDVGGTASPDTRDVTAWAATFDAAALASPEASVALYSLGRADLLAAATQELVTFLRARGLLRPQAHVLEIGCGIGRTAAAIAPHVSHVTGVDISSEMIAAARQRTTSRNVTYLQSNGRDLPHVASSSTELVLAIDVFPYLVATGAELLSSNIAECARVLTPRGRLLLFNFSYRGDDALDRRDVERLALEAGLRLRETGRFLRSWDGLLFDLQKP